MKNKHHVHGSFFVTARNAVSGRTLFKTPRPEARRSYPIQQHPLAYIGEYLGGG